MSSSRKNFKNLLSPTVLISIRRDHNTDTSAAVGLSRDCRWQEIDVRASSQYYLVFSLTLLEFGVTIVMEQFNLLKKRIPRGGVFDVARRVKDKRQWSARNYSMPAPPHVKHQVLARYDQGGIWVETGTFLGDTTAFLSKGGQQVFSIEPAEQLAERASSRFARSPNVQILKGKSEEIFEELINDLNGPISFWLDGHYSQGLTYQGKLETPILEELSAISRNLSHLNPITVLVDDVRCFDPLVDPAYPHRRTLTEWAEKAQLNWCFEHDIFIAWSTNSNFGK